MTSVNFTGHTYEYYERVITIVPIVVPLAIIPIVLTINCVCGCIHSAHPQILHGMASTFSFGEEKKHYLHGYGQGEKPPKTILLLLAIKAVLLLMFGLAVLLNESLIANETGCHTGWDCFTISNGQAIRIINCSDLGQFSDDAIQCYRSAIGYSTALSELGGIAFLSQVVINAYIVIYFSVRFITSRSLRVVSASFVIFLFFVVAFAAPIAFAVGHVRLTTVETLNFQMHNIIFGVYYPLLYVVVTLALIIRSKCTFDDYDAEYDPNTTVITVSGPTTTEGYGTTGESEVTTPARATVQIEQGNKVHIIKVN